MAVMKFLVYFTCFFLSQGLVFGDDYGEIGNEITLTPSIRGKPEEILWTLNGNKVLEYDGSEVTKYGSFKDRVEVDFETGQLTIRKLNSQDSGRYRSEIWINKKAQVSSQNLIVLDALPEPRVTCEMDETTNVKTLSCSVKSQTQPSYEWIGPDVKQTGPTLLVNEQEENSNPIYSCTVKNKAGSRTTDFDLKDCHTGGVNLAVLVPVLIVILLVILLALLALYLYRRRKQKLGKSELKKMDLENGECDTLLRNGVPMEAMPGSLEATLPCRTRLTAPKESIADKNWDQDSESEDAGETREEEKPLKESLQFAITEINKETEGELEINQKNCENADEAEEKANSKADEREAENQKSLQTQEDMEKSQMKNESEDGEESPEEQIETQEEQDSKDTDTKEEDQSTDEKKEQEEENEGMDSYNAVDTGDAAEQLHKTEKSSQNEKDDEQNKSPCSSVDDQKTEREKEENHEGTGRIHTAASCNPPLLGEAPSDPVEEKANSKADERGAENQKSLQTQEDMEKSQMKNESEDGEESPEEQIETQEEQDSKDKDTKEEDQSTDEKKEQERK
ncbi:lymphocyte function-associated antigen 3 isoform X2 [Puntigrus tetrazona]|uniref:lymphocyte function-associated antigen 3 isoform X2 n=1 Tax=Puntigrus tetrazona TaxID=1606681 RepID=UPI001C89B102|nr:lymphocyte function-associated antigen 3 isoform X2 [Puntigrus tetrazona]